MGKYDELIKRHSNRVSEENAHFATVLAGILSQLRMRHKASLKALKKFWAMQVVLLEVL